MTYDDNMEMTQDEYLRALAKTARAQKIAELEGNIGRYQRANHLPERVRDSKIAGFQRELDQLR